MEEKKTVFARFYNRQIRTGDFDNRGLPIFATKVYVEIKVVDSFDVVDRLAERQDFERFAKEYDKFLREAERTQKGIDLKMFAFLNPAEIECCNKNDIYTVEELAKTSKEKAEKMGIESQHEAAKKFLAVSKNNKVIADFQKQIEEMENKIASLQAENEELRNIKG